MKKYQKIEHSKMLGKVFLVGAGPGDPGLITLSGIKSLKNADVVIYDYLVPSILLNYVSSKAELIYVGKRSGNHTLSQENINKLIVEKANFGLNVVRLKGGDPFIFGRGGEEAEVLFKENINFEVIPGITSAIAASSYAGIPLTHRNYSVDLTFVTGHERYNKKKSQINWSFLGKSTGTIVFYMGVKNISTIVNNLKNFGKSSDTPIAIVRWATTPKQVTITGTLNTILKKVDNFILKPPCLIIVGEVVKLRKSIEWFEKKPLFGKTIVITRARSQASGLVKILSNFGCNCLEFPTIKIVKPKNWILVDNVIRNINLYDWFIFTSVNGVNFFFKRLFDNGKDSRIFGKIKIAVIGPSTALELLKYGLKSDIIPKNYCAESVMESFSKESIINKRICIPRAMEARAILQLELSKMGAIVNEVPVYQTLGSKENIDNFLKNLHKKKIDMLTFTSSSTVKNLVNNIDDKELPLLFKNIDIACIGPITAKTAFNFGFKVNIVASKYTVKGLSDSILDFYN